VGTNGYYSSYAETAIGVEEAPQETPQVTTNQVTTNAVTIADIQTYFIGTAVAIILAIAIEGIFLLRRRP